VTLFPIALYWFAAFWGLSSRKPVLIWLFFVSLPFGSMVVVPTVLTGGLSLLPATMTAMLIIVKQAMLKRSGPNAFATLALTAPGLWLFLFWCVAVVVTLFAPRIFAGEIQVIPMALVDYQFLQSMPLAPTRQNISQLAYITVSVFAVFAFARAFSEAIGGPGSGPVLLLLVRGLMLSGGIVIGTGALDFLATKAPIAPLLDLFRTANYAILNNVLIAGGAKRVTGLMPEASEFARLTLALLSALWFLRRTIIDRHLQRQCRTIIAGLVVMLVLSTSSAGYVGIAVCLIVVMVEWFVRAGRLEQSILRRRGIRREFVIALGTIGVLSAAILVVPQLFDPISDRLNALVFTKSESLSYLERTFWTWTSFQAGVSSHFIGVGLGSTRSSNFAVALFASTGILGFLLYFAFALTRLLTPIRSRDPQTVAVANALKWSFLPPFVVVLLIGTTPDFGTFEALRWGVLMTLVLGTAHGQSPQRFQAGQHRPAGSG